MRFFTVDTPVLHVTPDCRTVKRGGSTARAAEMPDIAEAKGLCIVCAPSYTGVLNPIRQERVWDR